MMMKRILCVVFSFILTIGVGAGCSWQPNAETTGKLLHIVQNGKSSFSLAYPSQAKEEVVDAVAWLQSAVKARTGAELPITQKDDATADLVNTIYVCELSEYGDTQLGELDYVISNNANSIVIQCGSRYAAALGVEQFFRDYVTRQGITYESGGARLVQKETINNAALMPVYTTDDAVKLETSGGLSTPDWFKSVIMTEVRIQTATPEGTFEAAVGLLDHYAEMGVNCLWLTPIYEMSVGGNGYGNLGLHTLEPKLTGTNDVEEGWKVVKNFIDEAHKRNIRVLLDIVTWGTVTRAPLREEHPEFFTDKEDWGGVAFDWTSEALQEWFIANAVENILKSSADGYRCDCEPNYAGYEVFAQIREKLYAQGKKVVILAEDGNNRQNAFDTEMDSVLDYAKKTRAEQYENPINFYLDDLNIVDSIRTGTGIGSSEMQKNQESGHFRFYTYGVTNHDYQWRLVNGNRLALGYQAIYAPFIPYWYMGDEFGATIKSPAVLYDVPVRYSLKEQPENRLFFEDVKQMIRIRLSYPEIFTNMPDDHCDSNICAIETTGLTKLQAYARYAGNQGIMVVPNYEESSDGYFCATIPYTAMKLDGFEQYRLTNLLTEQVLAEGTKEELASFEDFVRYEYMGVYLIEGIN